MNKNIFFGHNDLRFLYFRYKDSVYYSISIFITVIIVSVILVFKVVIPQMDNYFSIHNESLDLQSKINTINENITLMSNIDKPKLNQQLQTAIQALPSDKDFSGIVNAISDTAVSSGVSVEDFSFHFYNKQGKLQAKDSSLVPIEISIITNGSINNQKKFLVSILQKIPLAQVLSVDGDSGTLNINMQYYYKPFSKTEYKEDKPISQINNADAALINNLSTWKTRSFDIDNENRNPESSSSATPLF